MLGTPPKSPSKGKPLSFAQNEHQVIDDFIHAFPSYVQSIIEKYYLLPYPFDLTYAQLPAQKKENLQDGRIEREIFGAMNASRLGITVEILHRFIKAFFPSFTKEVLGVLENAFNLKAPQILALVSFTAICQHCQRVNDDPASTDYSNICQDLLIHQGVNKNLAALLTVAANCQDNSADFKSFLNNTCHVNPALHPSFDYIRKLVLLANTFESMRTKNTFRLKLIFDIFSSFNGFDQKIHLNPIIDLASNIHSELRQQGDMLKACRMLLPDSTCIIAPSTHASSLRKKVGFEHAENVYIALYHSLKANPFLGHYLNAQFTQPVRLYPGEPVFNPFIHATTSILCTQIANTDWTLHDPMAMLEKYNRVPFGGEISKGGLRNGVGCLPCFARMNVRIGDPESEKLFNLDQVVQKYCYLKPYQANKIISQLRKMIVNHQSQLLKNISVTLILFGRARQLGIPFSKIFFGKYTPATFLQEAAGMISLFYLFLLFGKYIFPNYSLINMQDKEELVADFNQHYKVENLLQKIIHSRLNLKEIYDNPSSENLQKVLSLLTLPKFNPFFLISEKTRSLQGSTDSEVTNLQWELLTEGEPFRRVIRIIALGESDVTELNDWKQMISTYLQMLEKRVSLLKKMFLEKENTLAVANEDKIFLNHPFPLLLISESEEKISISEFNKQEYRANAPLKIGVDITMLATDTKEHAEMLLLFLKQHHKNNVQVVLFSDLKKAQTTGKRPEGISYPTSSSGFSLKSSFLLFQGLLKECLHSPSKHPFLVACTLGLLMLNISVLSGVFAALGMGAFLKLRNHLYQQKRIEKSTHPKSILEKQAYHLGIESGKSWTLYFKNSCKLAAWKHPGSFGAGLYRSQEKDYKEKPKVF